MNNNNINIHNNSTYLTNYYNTFLCYYSILLNSSKLSINKFVNAKFSFEIMFKYRQLIMNLSSNFLDSSFIKLLKVNPLVIKRIFSFILFNLFVFESSLFNTNYYNQLQHLKIKKKKDLNAYEKYTSEESQEIEYKNFLISIILYDLVNNIITSDMGFYLENEEYLKDIALEFTGFCCSEYMNYIIKFNLSKFKSSLDEYIHDSSEIFKVNNYETAINLMYTTIGYSKLDLNGNFCKSLNKLYYIKYLLILILLTYSILINSKDLNLPILSTYTVILY